MDITIRKLTPYLANAVFKLQKGIHSCIKIFRFFCTPYRQSYTSIRSLENLR